GSDSCQSRCLCNLPHRRPEPSCGQRSIELYWASIDGSACRGAALRKKRILGLLVVAGAVVAVAGLLLPERPPPDSAQPARTQARSPSSGRPLAALPSPRALRQRRPAL